MTHFSRRATSFTWSKSHYWTAASYTCSNSQS